MQASSLTPAGALTGNNGIVPVAGATATNSFSGSGGDSAASQGGGSGLTEGKQAATAAIPEGAAISSAVPAAAQAGPILTAIHTEAEAVQTAKGAAGGPAGDGLMTSMEPAKGNPPPAGPGSDAPLPALNTAQLVHSMGQSEMRVGMHSQEFGSISISTTLSRQELAAQISIDHTGLGDALAAHLPGMQEKLGAAYGVQARVEIRDTGAQFDGGGAAAQQDAGAGPGQGGSGHSRRQPAALQQTTFGDAAGSVAATLGPTAGQVATSAGTARLSIRI